MNREELVQRFGELIWTKLIMDREDADKIAVNIAQEIERLLADERERFVVIIRRLTSYVDAYGPRDHLNGAATKKLVREARDLTASSSTEEGRSEKH